MTQESDWINLEIDSQVLSSFMSCPKRMNFNFNMHLVPITGTKPSYQKGTLVHTGLAAYYNCIKRTNDKSLARREGIAAAKVQAPSLVSMKPDDILEVYDHLEQYFSHRINEIFTVLAVEKVFKTIVYEVFPLRIILTGKIDLIIKDIQNQIVPWDHKTESERWFHSSLRNQYKIYCTVLQVNTIIVNRFGFQKSMKPEQKFAKETITVQNEAKEEFVNEVLPHYARLMLDCINTGYYPPNFTSCTSGHFACEFSDKYNGGICNQPKEIQAMKLQRYFMVGEEWDPSNEG